MKRILLVLGCLFLLATPSVWAVSPAALADIDNAKSLLAGDFNLFSGWFAEQISHASAGLADSGYAGPASALKFGHFELGIQASASASPLDAANLKSLKTQVLSIGDSTSTLPTMLPVPVGRLRGHFGLPSLLVFENTDIGLSLGGFNVASGDIKVDVSVVGADFRGNLLQESTLMPLTLCLGLVVDSVKGNVTVGNAMGTSTSDDGTYTRTISNMKMTGKFDFRNVGIGLRAVASKHLLCFTPYAGVGAQINAGNTDASIGITGDLKVQNDTNALDNLTQAYEVTGTGSAPVEAVDGRLLGGLEIDIFALYLALGGEYAFISNTFAVHGGLGLSF